MPGSEAAVSRPEIGRQDEFRLLVEQHSRALFGLAWRMTGNQQDAEEIVQETFLHAYRSFDRFDGRAQPGTWLHRIAVNCALDLLRARRHDAGRVELQAAGSDAGDAVPARDTAPGPERLLLSAEVKRRLTAALGRLSPTERAAFVLRHYQGCPIEEISRELRMSENAAKNCVFRAVQKLREALQPLV